MFHSPNNPQPPSDGIVTSLSGGTNTTSHLRWGSAGSQVVDYGQTGSRMASTSRDRKGGDRMKSPDSAGTGTTMSSKRRVVSTVPREPRMSDEGGMRSLMSFGFYTAWAKHDPPSPPTSPRLFPTSPSLVPTHKPGPSLSSLDPVLSPTSDLTRSQSPLNTVSSIEEIDPTLPAPWWTFTRPKAGNFRSLSGLQARWHEHVEQNERLREESEHVGKDYFDTKKKLSIGEMGDAGRLGTLEEEGEISGMSSRRASADIDRDGGAGVGKMRGKPLFKAVSLPGSRRTSTDNVRPLSGTDRTFTLGLPISLRPSNPGSRRNSSSSTHILKTPQRSKSNPPLGPLELEPCLEDGPGSPTGSIPAANQSAPDLVSSPVPIHGPLTPATPKSSTVRTPGRKRQPPQLNIQLPPPVFTAEPATYIIRPRFQAQSPPTPDGWDRPFSLVSDRASSGLGRESSTFNRQGEQGSADDGMVNAWNQPYESQYGSGSHSRENGGTETSGETLVDPPSGRRRAPAKFTFSRGGRNTQPKGRRGRGVKEESAWSALRKKTVKEGIQGRWTTRWRTYLIFDARSAIYLRLFALACTTVALGMFSPMFFVCTRKADFILV